MNTIKGPAIFLAQFAGDDAPFNCMDSIAAWAANLGYQGVQLPSVDARLFNMKRAADSPPANTLRRPRYAAPRFIARPILWPARPLKADG